VKNALAPAKTSNIIVNANDKSITVIVPDDQLSLAIGKKGQNVKLAVKLLHCKIDIKSESEYKKEAESKIEGQEEGIEGKEENL
ncbi:MAG: KH domain-containing protein, partial [Nitrospinae bacterium]|nr:KH domain-containing protein [Nitrospinota bacterium]